MEVSLFMHKLTISDLLVLVNTQLYLARFLGVLCFFTGALFLTPTFSFIVGAYRLPPRIVLTPLSMQFSRIWIQPWIPAILCL
jgi:hypothetical protein